MPKTKDCPNCGKSGSLAKVFGYRNTSDESSPYYLVPHSWCNECRAGQRKKSPMPNTFTALKRAFKAEYPNSKTVQATASFYVRKLLETGKYKE